MSRGSCAYFGGGGRSWSATALDTAKRRKFLSYTLEFKLEAVNHVKMGKSQEATARKFGVAPKRIREWCKQEHKLHSQSDHSSQEKWKRLKGGGRRPPSTTLEMELYAWIELQRSKRLRVTRKKSKKRSSENFQSEQWPCRRCQQRLCCQQWVAT